MKVNFQVTIDKNIKMNLSQGAFRPVIMAYDRDHQFSVRVPKDEVSRLIQKNLPCTIEVPHAFEIEGVIQKITEKNGDLIFTCTASPGLCRKLYDHFKNGNRANVKNLDLLTFDERKFSP